MPDSIKKRILAGALQVLSPLINDHTLQLLRRETNPVARSEAKPALFVYDETETEIAKDHRGRTYEFPLTLVLHFENSESLADAKDDLVPRVQQLIESSPTLGGVAVNVDGGAEDPVLTEATRPGGIVVLAYRVTYRRLRGDPYTTY